MAFDLMLDRATGDWLFSANMDLKPVSGDELIGQRIKIRTVIPRGTFVYDENRTLGSRLYEAMRMPSNRAMDETPAIIEEALEPMRDIAVQQILISAADGIGRQFRATVLWHAVSTFTDSLLTEADLSSVQTSIVVPPSFIGGTGDRED
jgi:hypothetical protein